MNKIRRSINHEISGKMFTLTQEHILTIISLSTSVDRFYEWTTENLGIAVVGFTKSLKILFQCT